MANKIETTGGKPIVQQFQRPRLATAESLLSGKDTPKNVPEEKFPIPLGGKLITSTDPVHIGENFSTLTNMRYGDNNPETILGHVKINSSIINSIFPNVQSAFHFRKHQPSESHLLVQCYGIESTSSSTSGTTSTSTTSGTTGTGQTAGTVGTSGTTTTSATATTATTSSTVTTAGVSTVSTTSIVATTRLTTTTSVVVKAGTSGTAVTCGTSRITTTSSTASTTIVASTSISETTASVIIQSTYAIPYTDTGISGTSGIFGSTEIWRDSTSGTSGQWSDCLNGQVAYCNKVDTCIWGGAEMRCGAFLHFGTTGIAGTGGTAATFSYDYTDRITNTNTDAEQIVTVTKGTDGLTQFHIGSVRPLQGAKFHLLTPNSTSGGGAAGTAIGKYWDGAAEQSLVITDNTKVGTLRLAQTGTVTFPSTVTTAKLRYLDGRLLYFYTFQFSGLATNTSIYHVTLDAPFQSLYDLWDGVFRNVAAFYKRTTTYNDYTLYVNSYEYDSADSTTYADLSILSAFSEPDNCLEIGFTEKQTGIAFDIPEGYTNGTAATVMTVDAWNGKEYATVGTISDGTAEGGISFAKSGVVTWFNTNLASESKKSINNGLPLYFYRVKFDQALDSSVRVFFVSGMTATQKISGYSFSLIANDRLMLGCNNFANKNTLRISAKNSPDVFNGIDTFEIPFGDERPLMCGASIFAQYSSNIFNMVLLFKQTESWVLTWLEDDTGTIWERFRISPFIGCPSPRTLKIASVAFDKNITQTKLIGIWRGHNGIYISNGQAPLEVSDDIRNVFDQSKALHVNLDMAEYEYAFIDYHLLEYHWMWASNDSQTLDKEYVLDLRKWKWFDVDRTTGQRFQVGVSVTSTDERHYAYGFTPAGYMYETERGNSFNGVAITSTLRFGALLPGKDMLDERRIVRANLVTKAKNKQSDITMTHYINEANTGVSYTLSDADASHRIANAVREMFSQPGVFHSFQLSKATSTEVKGFEPLGFAVYHTKERDHVK